MRRLRVGGVDVSGEKGERGGGGEGEGGWNGAG